ncbi:MAG: hypothetical protein FGF50_01615 [Candidatus Brockarchaeota archaeon]|nr:hypothetical protein [Candidatus Brockarchaeota archaeon]
MRIHVAIITAVITVMVIGIGTWCLYSPVNFQTVKESFETGLDEWVTDADVPLDPNKPGHYVEWNITRSTDVASSGQYSLKLFIDGRQDDGTIWIERKIAVPRNVRINVNISFDFYSERESFNTMAVICAYAGIRNPEAEESFSGIGPADEVAGWKRYRLTATIDTGSSGEIWVALGISVRWETHMTYYIDAVEIEVR